MNAVKPFKTIDEQIQILKYRGIVINDCDIEKSRNFLLNNNYYRISGYSLTLRKNDIFFQNISIENLIQIYEADKRMRHIMLSITEVVETRLKSLVSYYHAATYGPLGYLDINNFNCIDGNNKVKIMVTKDYMNIARKANQQKSLNCDSELFLQHHRDNKNGELPFWVYVELLTISDISKFYTILDENIQKTIAIDLGFKSNNANEIIQNLLHCTSILRNICAHGGRLYNRLFIRKPWLSSKDKRLLRKDNDQIVFNKLFSYILILKSLTQQNDFSILKDHLIEIHNNYTLINFKHYGFPDNWINIL